MIDWTRYPLVRLFIPFLLGIFAGYLCIIEWYWILSTKSLIVTTSGLVCSQIVCDYLFSKQPYRHKGYVFNILAFTTFFLLGLTLSAKSHTKAWNLYGESYKYEIYKQNNFQNEKALAIQQMLHHRFSSQPSFKELNHHDECAVIEAMTIGWREGLSKELKQRYAHAGISHYLALSGYHVGVIFLILLYFFKRINNDFKWQRIWNVLILLVLWGYALLTGMSPSIVRATIMCSVITLFKILQRDIELVNACTLAAFLILACDPLLINHIGFQLSFCSVYGIALMGRWIPWNFFWGGLGICVICTIATAPLVAYHFGSIPLYGMLSNIYATFLAPPILVLSLLWWLVTAGGQLITHLSDGIATLLQWVTWSLNKIASSVSHLPYATLHIRPNITEVLLCYVCIFTLVSLFYKVTRKRILFLLLLLIGTLFLAFLRKMDFCFGFFKE